MGDQENGSSGHCISRSNLSIVLGDWKRLTLHNWPRRFSDHRLENRETAFADETPTHSPLGIDDNGGREFATVELSADHAAWIPEHRVVDSTLLDCTRNFSASVFQRVLSVLSRFRFFLRFVCHYVTMFVWDAIESHTKNGDLFIRFVLKRNEVEYLRDTSGAPCRPEIEHYDLSAKW